jgi:hypothetical protein
MQDDNSQKKKPNAENSAPNEPEKPTGQESANAKALSPEASEKKDFISELIDKSLFDSQWFQEENWSLVKDPNTKNSPEQFSFFVGGDSDGDGCSSGGDAGDSGGSKGCAVGDSGGDSGGF